MIVQMTSVHQPLDVRIFQKECRALAQAGHTVVLIAPHDRDEVVDGVRIKAVPRRSGRLARMTATMWAVYKAALRERGQVYHFHDPELIPVGLLLKLAGRCVVYDAHEDVPASILTKEYLTSAWQRRLISRAAAVVERAAAACFDRVVAATPAIAGRFPAGKTVVIQNFPIAGEFAAKPGAAPHAERPPVLAYVGGLTEIRGVREMVGAIARLPEVNGARLTLAGRFSSAALEEEARGLDGWDRVDFLGQRSRAQVAALLQTARAGLVLFHPVPNHLESQPNKLFEYMAAGLPLIASDFPLWRSLIERIGCGLLVDPRDPDAIAEAMGWLLAHPDQSEAMGRRGAEAVRRELNWAPEAARLRGMYRDLTTGRPRGA